MMQPLLPGPLPMLMQSAAETAFPISICLSLPMLAPALACLCIAFEYDASSSACSSGVNMVSVQMFLYVAGAVQLVMSLITLVFLCWFCCCAITMRGGSPSQHPLHLKEFIGVLYLACAFAPQI